VEDDFRPGEREGERDPLNIPKQEFARCFLGVQEQVSRSVPKCEEEARNNRSELGLKCRCGTVSECV